MTSIYQYANGDLLKNPQKYQMSPYLGSNFLIAYKNSRSNILNILNKKSSKSYSIKEICKHYDLNLNDNFLFKLEHVDIVTKEILNQILFCIIKKSKIEKIKEILDIFVKKFETKKRLFSSYDMNFKESSNDYSTIINYIMLSTISLLEYEKTANLRYLNVSLKINDTLSSQIQKINNEFEISLLKYSIKKELDFVSKLCHQKGIEEI